MQERISIIGGSMLAVQLAIFPLILLAYRQSNEYKTKPKITIAVACFALWISLMSIYSSAQLALQEHNLTFLLDINIIPSILYFILGIWLIHMVVKSQ